MNIPSNLPAKLGQELITGATDKSAVLKVTDVKPQASYLNQGFITMTGELKAASLGPGDARKGSSLVNAVVEVPVRTLSVVYRFPEVLASIDSEINGGLLEKAIEKGKGAIGKAIDKIALAGKDGFDVAVSGQVYASQTTKSVEVVDSAEYGRDAALNAAIRLLVEKGYPTSAIFDTLFGYDLSMETGDFGRLNPVNIADVFELKGMKAVTSANVQAAGSTLDGFVFDKDVFKVSIGQNISVSHETTGDPDNTGRDLKGHREQAIVLDVPYAVGILDLSRIVKLVDAVDESIVEDEE